MKENLDICLYLFEQGLEGITFQGFFLVQFQLADNSDNNRLGGDQLEMGVEGQQLCLIAADIELFTKRRSTLFLVDDKDSGTLKYRLHEKTAEKGQYDNRQQEGKDQPLTFTDYQPVIGEVNCLNVW